MNPHRVLIAAPAEADIEACYVHIQQDSPANAVAWRIGLYEAAAALESMLTRCALAPENGLFDFEIRQIIYGNYRVLFTIRQNDVVILHVRHGARKWMTPDDVIPPDS